jgi:hypothetical protein
MHAVLYREPQIKFWRNKLELGINFHGNRRASTESQDLADPSQATLNSKAKITSIYRVMEKFQSNDNVMEI